MSTIDGPLGATPGGAGLELKERARANSFGLSATQIGQLSLASVLGCGILVCLAAARTNSVLPESIQPVVGALAGPLHFVSFHLTSGELIVALLAMFAGYVCTVRYAERLSPRLVLVAVGVLLFAVLLAPPLFSTDVFSYQEYARMFFGLHLNPYTNSSHVLSLAPQLQDPIYSYIPSKWLTTPTVYGPLFTLLSGFFQNTATTTDIALSVFFYKTVAALSCAGIVYMLWKSAKLRGVSPVRAVAMFGLNPLIVLYGVGGGHNDLLMMLFATAGIWTMLTRRERSSGALAITAAAVKLTGGIFLPFALVADVVPGVESRWRRVAFGAAVALVISLGVGLAVFGSPLSNVLNTLSEVQGMGGWQSIPGFFSDVLSWQTASHIVSFIFGLCFVLIGCRLLWRVREGNLDWLEGAGWSTFWLLMATSQIVPWYICWLMVPMALCTSRRLWVATTWFSGWLLLTTVLQYLPHFNTISTP